MNSLKFIDEEIAYYNDMYERKLVALDLIKEDSIGGRKLKDEVSFCRERLKHLQQIKVELEAWYIVKKHLNRGEYVGLKNFFRFDLDKYNTLEKALEVNNND